MHWEYADLPRVFHNKAYAKFGGQTECIMDNWKIVNEEDEISTELFPRLLPSLQDLLA